MCKQLLVTFSGSLCYLNGEVYVERVRSKSAKEKKSQDPAEIQTKTFGILVERSYH